MCIGMCRHQSCIRQTSHIPETLFVEVREVEHDAQAIAGTHQFFACIGQTGSGIGRMRVSERHTLRENIGATPYNTQGAQSSLVEDFECIKAGIDSFGSFAMENCGKNIFAQTRLKFYRCWHYFELSL